MQRINSSRIAVGLIQLLAAGSIALAEDPSLHVSGHVKSLNYLTEATGLNEELHDDPQNASESGSGNGLFNSYNQFRLKLRSAIDAAEGHRLSAVVEYDHLPQFGNYVSGSDFAYNRAIAEDRQSVDLIWTLDSGDDVSYDHLLYRAYLAYQADVLTLKIGRQQIPWGVGYFFTPSDVFNPFFSTQLELDERQGVDAVYVTALLSDTGKLELVFTPDGRSLHPARYMARLSADLSGIEAGVLGGSVDQEPVAGFDMRGNVGEAGVRAECLARDPEGEAAFIQCSANSDYNLPGNVYVSLEYFYNGEGSRNEESYDIDRYLLGEILQLAKNYIGAIAGHDITPLLRGELRQIVNVDDGGVFIRPQLSYSLQDNLVLLTGCQLFVADGNEEYASARDMYFFQAKYNF